MSQGIGAEGKGEQKLQLTAREGWHTHCGPLKVLRGSPVDTATQSAAGETSRCRAALPSGLTVRMGWVGLRISHRSTWRRDGGKGQTLSALLAMCTAQGGLQTGAFEARWHDGPADLGSAIKQLPKTAGPSSYGQPGPMRRHTSNQGLWHAHLAICARRGQGGVVDKRQRCDLQQHIPMGQA